MTSEKKYKEHYYKDNFSSGKDQSKCDSNSSIINLSETLLSEDNVLTTTKENVGTNKNINFKKVKKKSILIMGVVFTICYLASHS